MPALTGTLKTSKSVFSPTARLTELMLISVTATVFDAYSSYQIIVVNPIAMEGNPIWGAIAAMVGFGGAMVVRALIGIALLLGLWGLANQTKDLRARRSARFFLRFATAILLLLTAYHIALTVLGAIHAS